MKKPKAVFNWSGGKDSSICLYKTLRSGDYEVSYLFTTVNEKHNRISQHGVRYELLEKQAENIGIPLWVLRLPDTPTMESYNRKMAEALGELKNEGISVSIFGDIFLEDLRQYREDRLSELGYEGIFPLWKLETVQLANEFIEMGFKAVVVCVDERYLDKSFVGREYDDSFLNDLPEGVDHCGENGEFHTFVYDGPIFGKPVPFSKGEVVYRKYSPPKRNDKDNESDYTCGNDRSHYITTGFWYCDLLQIN